MIKHVINDNGGTAVAANFTLDSGGPGAARRLPGCRGTRHLSLDERRLLQRHRDGAEWIHGQLLGRLRGLDRQWAETKTCTVTNNDIPVDSQITPPTATCAQFKAGTAATLSQLNYSVRNGKIHQVTPSAFYYWVKVTAVAGSNTFTINQAITTGNFDSHFYNH